MPRARNELLDAARRYAPRSENRLSEILALVLSTHDEFAGSLLRHVGLPVGDRFEVLRQEKVAPGCVLDMVVRSARAAGGLVSELWCEHKTVSDFRPEQREDYARELASRHGEGRLLTITPRSTDDVRGLWEHMTWQQLGELADRVGRGWHRSDWRKAALAPEAPARARLLHELLWYLEQEGYSVTRPMTPDDIHVFGAIRETADLIATLLDEAAAHLNAVESNVDEEDDYICGWFVIEPPTDSWLDSLAPGEAFCDCAIADSDDWWPQGTGEPAVGAGYSFDSKEHGRLSGDTEWLDCIEEAGYSLEPWTNYLRCWQTKPLADFLTDGDSLSVQAKAIADWARRSIEGLSQIIPQHLAEH